MGFQTRYLRNYVGAVFGLLALNACATPDPDTAFSGLDSLVAERVPERIVWRTGGPEDAAVDARVAALLAEPLSVDAAVAVALLSNRGLQARYAELGIAQADVVQAGLLQNPVFEIMVRPSTEEGTNLEFGLMQNFVDLLMRPARQKVAAAEYEATRLELAAHLIEFSGDVQAAYYKHRGALGRLGVIEEMADTAGDSADLSKAFHNAGNISDLEDAQHQAEAAQVRIELLETQEEVRETRTELAEYLGIEPVGEWSVPSRLPPVPEETVRMVGLEDRALRTRFDLSAHRAELQAAIGEAGMEEDFRYFEEGELAISAEREPDGAWLIGPALEIPIPLFDQGQARVTAAQLEVRRLRDSLLAEERHVRSKVIVAADAMASARARALHLRDTLLPIRENIVRLTLAEYNFMLESPFHLLETQQEANETYLKYVEALTEYWLARTALTAAIGGGTLDTDTGDAS